MLKLFRFIKLNKNYILALPRSLYYNLRFFPFKIAIHLPLFISNTTKICKSGIRRGGGKICINAPIHAGMIKIGFSQCQFISQRTERTILHIGESVIEFNGTANIGAGSRISVDNNAILTFGDHFWATGRTYIICRNRIIFEQSCILAWNITIMDHDAHIIINNENNIIQNQPRPIKLKKHCWIGMNSTILKGVTIPENSVIAANSTITKTFNINNIIIGGGPGKIIKQNISWT